MSAIRESIAIMQKVDHKTKFNFFLWLCVYSPILIITSIAFFGLINEGLPANENPNIYYTMLSVLVIPMVLFALYLIKRSFFKKTEVISSGKKDYPNGFHLIATLLTGGFWAIGWAFMYLKRNKTIYN